MRTIEDIWALYTDRRKRLDPIHSRAIEIRDIYNGDFAVPLPERDSLERPAVANLLYSGLEQKAMRVASTMPNVYWPSTRPGIKERDDRAATRRYVNLAWWDHTRQKNVIAKRARHLIGYASSPIIVRPHRTDPRPEWHVRDPLACYPASLDCNELVPDDVIFTSQRTWGWCHHRYPGAAAHPSLGARTITDETPVTLLEYFDADVYVLAMSLDRHTGPATGAIECERVPNRTGRPLCVIPGRVTLDRPKGEFDGLVGIYQMQAKLMALELIGMERAVWPETWLVGPPAGGTPRIVNMADAHSGEIGIVEGGSLSTVRIEPGALGASFVDRLERAQRIESGIPAELGGEAASNVRTGRRGDAILSATLDFGIQAAQQLLEQSLEEENRIAVAIDKAFYPTSKSIFVSATGGQITYTAADLWETDRNHVRYAQAGADANRLVIAGGQRVGLGTLSRRGFMELDPLIEDPERESDQVTYEQLEDALRAGIQARAQSDPTFAPVLAEIMQRVRLNRQDLADAYIAVNAEWQAKQADAQNPATPEPEMAEMMPGAANPTVEAAPNVPPNLDRMTDLLLTLRAGQRAAS